MYKRQILAYLAAAVTCSKRMAHMFARRRRQVATEISRRRAGSDDDYDEIGGDEEEAELTHLMGTEWSSSPRPGGRSAETPSPPARPFARSRTGRAGRGQVGGHEPQLVFAGGAVVPNSCTIPSRLVPAGAAGSDDSDSDSDSMPEL